MNDEPVQPHIDRRTREHARLAARQARRRHRVHVLGGAAGVALVGLVLLVTTDTLRFGGATPSFAGGKSATTTTTVKPSTESGSVSTLPPPRPISHDQPLRLWVGGDSIAGELGYQIGPMLAKTGIVKAHVDYKVSSGIANNGVRNWPQRFAAEAQQYQPEAVVFMVGANDSVIVGSAVDPASGQPAWEVSYRARVDTMMDLLVGGSLERTVFWIGSPPLRDSNMDHGAQELDRVMREEAAKRPTVVYVDAYAMFSVQGHYAVDLPDNSGKLTQMRIGDGVHFTVDGAQFLAENVYKLLDQRWHITSHSVPASPIDYTLEEGGTVGGTNLTGRSGGSGNGSSAGSTSTTSAATPTSSASTTSAPASSSTTAAPPTTSGGASTTVPATSTTTKP